MLVVICALLGSALAMLIGAVLFIKLNKKYPAGIDILSGLSAGFLLMIIFGGIIPEAQELIESAAPHYVLWLLPSMVAAGVLIVIIFERVVPVEHHCKVELEGHEHFENKNLFFVVLGAFGLHSLFEMISVLLVSHSNQTMGILLAIILGLHSIPIGFIIAVQLEFAHCSEKKIMTGITGLAFIETAASAACYYLIRAAIGDALQGIMLAVTAGVMLFVLFDELLPRIYYKTDGCRSNHGIVIGIIMMMLLLSAINH